ncbi:HNH endonuclease signature motif containing protein [Microbacterium sp. SS28]|uniref:HNH endonuclease signature motif containing protein n=1 Tax=Microbacterium sp. SS28 TaxID=2919948 RepID=UPI001FAA6B07|nr:HNH endonuclease signature motif containing protein [Microbacterium sp. SS28]
MEHLAAALDDLGDAVVGLAGATLGDGRLARAADQELLEVMAAAARLARGAEALLIEATAQVVERSNAAAVSDRLTTRLGCRSVGELVQRVTRVSKRAGADLVTASGAVLQPIAPATGEVLPAGLPGMRAALAAGEVGVHGVLAVAESLRGCSAGRAQILAADEELAAAARGEGVDAAPPVCAEELRALASVWAMYLDQDGAEPRESRALRTRSLTLGTCRDGIVPVRGALLAEVAGQLQRLFDSVLNPKLDAPVFVEDFEGDEPSPVMADVRSRAQKQHDALATILNAAAASGSLPQLGGSAPTLVVSVRAEDLQSGRGFGHVGGVDEPVSLAAVRHIACSGAVQRVVFDERGRIVELGSLERIFTHHQRRAMALRDGGCVIPGCHVPAAWCETHHVVEHSHGGPTHPDNGVLLCWFHHRTLESSGWQIRMRLGIPEVRGPSWWDAHMRWRPATKSPIRMRERMSQRT